MSMTDIHSTAVIGAEAKIGKDVNIGPYCVVGPSVQLSDAVTLKAHVVVDGQTIIGSGTTIYPFASIGSAPQASTLLDWNAAGSRKARSRPCRRRSISSLVKTARW